MRLASLFVLALPVCLAAATSDIKVDQAGYLPGLEKVAFVVSKAPVSEFYVKRAADSAAVFHGTLTAPVDDRDSGDRVQAADFTTVRTAGTYYVEVPGVGQSFPFAIGLDVYRRTYLLAMRSYYGQRCGTAVDLGPEFPGYKHVACHLQGAYHPSSGKSGTHVSAFGWHDAGDYGRYIVNSGITTGTLLWTWELFGPRVKGVSLQIPESGKGLPDILSEIRWNLDWMLTMQDTDGGVWHKQTSEKFSGFVMPEDDHSVSVVIGTGSAPYKTSCASGDFAAVMAIAARVYQPFDAAYAAKCLRAARSAWKWLEKYPNVTFQNPEGVGTGAYGDRNCGDEQLWAAAELWRTTKEAAYERYFLANEKQYRESLRSVSPEGWANVAPLALWTYVLGAGKNAAAVAAIREASLDAADGIVERSRGNGYRISLTSTDYVWGSNGVAANYGMQLLVANVFRRDTRYVQAAADDLSYLLGRNTFSLSWVTGVGANSYKHPHHRPSGADGIAEPWPGLLSGGPNRGRQDAVLAKLPSGLAPAKVYADDQESYASNEIAINWNAPLVFVLAGLLPV